ncbi:hypothetical protein LTR66_012782 [Elasticomyces elasticus]|nr:hypothetical protein LTR66_012782 [Elasticomyces elasticus]
MEQIMYDPNDYDFDLLNLTPPPFTNDFYTGDYLVEDLANAYATPKSNEDDVFTPSEFVILTPGSNSTGLGQELYSAEFDIESLSLSPASTDQSVDHAFLWSAIDPSSTSRRPQALPWHDGTPNLSGDNDAVVSTGQVTRTSLNIWGNMDTTPVPTRNSSTLDLILQPASNEHAVFADNLGPRMDIDLTWSEILNHTDGDHDQSWCATVPGEFQALDHQSFLATWPAAEPQASSPSLTNTITGRAYPYVIQNARQSAGWDFAVDGNSRMAQRQQEPLELSTTGPYTDTVFSAGYPNLHARAPCQRTAAESRIAARQVPRVLQSRSGHTSNAISSPDSSRKIPLHASDARQKNIGGRPLKSRLPEPTRKRTAETRKRKACWRCAFQRDTCPPGPPGLPCDRCVESSKRLHTYHFQCTRIQLSDLAEIFLPSVMKSIHERETIFAFVDQHVHRWRTSPIRVSLTSGHGPPLCLNMYEFEPKTTELLSQHQYTRDPDTHKSIRWSKLSPPLGIRQEDDNDVARFEAYINLIIDDHLLGFSSVFFADEIDDCPARLLTAICELYTSATDTRVLRDLMSLKALLRLILQMIVVTYIMDHTLTMVESTKDATLANVRGCYQAAAYGKHTSPRLANRQLKFFLSILRDKIYKDVLKHLHKFLRSSENKHSTWLSSFCIVSGLAMVLEDDQQTLLIQADDKIAREELDQDTATAQAVGACQAIDERFEFLVALFQCKYKKGSPLQEHIGSNTSGLTRLAEVTFACQLQHLLRQKGSPMC